MVPQLQRQGRLLLGPWRQALSLPHVLIQLRPCWRQHRRQWHSVDCWSHDGLKPLVFPQFSPETPLELFDVLVVASVQLRATDLIVIQALNLSWAANLTSSDWH